MAALTYTIMLDPARHTCWDDPSWDGTLVEEGKCKGCDQAASHKCEYCGYGHVFTTHNPEPHEAGGDPQIPIGPPDWWTDSPHIYTKEN